VYRDPGGVILAARLMIFLITVLVIGPAALNIPAWLYARRHRGATAFLPWLAVPALCLWSGLLLLGVGQGTLGNLVEGVWIAGLGVFLVYLQVFALDRVWKRPRRTSAMLALALCIVAGILRVWMPDLPE
jgi:hypothetical protein